MVLLVEGAWGRRHVRLMGAAAEVDRRAPCISRRCAPTVDDHGTTTADSKAEAAAPARAGASSGDTARSTGTESSSDVPPPSSPLGAGALWATGRTSARRATTPPGPP